MIALSRVNYNFYPRPYGPKGYCHHIDRLSVWTGFLLLEGSELMHTSSLVAYHITSFMLYESSYTDVRFGTD